MIPQVAKDLYYLSLGKLTYLNYLRYSLRNQSMQHDRLILHLGSGKHALHLPGFVNIDGNFRRNCDMWLDVTLGLPFPSGSVTGVFSNHFMEHLTEEQVRKVFAHSFRVLKPGGIIRIVTPDLKKSIEAYNRVDSKFFPDFPDTHTSLGGRFNNHLLCRDQHRLMFDFGFLVELLNQAGFAKCREVSPRQSRLFTPAELPLMCDEKEEYFASLFVEAEKTQVDGSSRPSRMDEKTSLG